MADKNKTIIELERDSKTQMVVMCLIMCVVVAIGIFLAVYFKQIKMTSEVTVEAKKVSSFEELAALNNTMLNDNYFLTNDIIINEPFVLGSKDNPLTGKIFGNGHSIIINYNADSSIIYQVGKEGKVSNLEVEYKLATSEITENFGGIVTFNYGTISDCLVTYQDSLVVNEALTVGGICALNFGKLQNCICKVKFVENSNQLANSRMGGLVGVLMENGSIENCFSLASSQLIENIDAVVENGQLKNYNIGCVYGQKATNTKITNVYTIKSSLLYCDKFDTSIVWDVKTEFASKEFYYNTLKFELSVWNIDSIDAIDLVITNINE